jgi:hypothetical protein
MNPGNSPASVAAEDRRRQAVCCRSGLLSRVSRVAEAPSTPEPERPSKARWALVTDTGVGADIAVAQKGAWRARRFAELGARRVRFPPAAKLVEASIRSRSASTRAESAGPRSDSVTKTWSRGDECSPSFADSGWTGPDQGGSGRITMARTDEGHQRRAPWAVGTWSASRPRAIWPRVLPVACSARMRSATSEGTAGGRPTGAGCGRGGTGRRRSARCSSSSSIGISTRPPSSSIVSTNGTTLRLTVDALTPSASAACTIEYANRSTLSAAWIAPGSKAGRRVF